MDVRGETDRSERSSTRRTRRHEDTKSPKEKEEKKNTHTMPHASFALSATNRLGGGGGGGGCCCLACLANHTTHALSLLCAWCVLVCVVGVWVWV